MGVRPVLLPLGADVIVSWSGGLPSRLRAMGVDVSAVAVIRRDFSTFARDFLLDSRVGSEAKHAFAEHFLTDRIVSIQEPRQGPASDQPCVGTPARPRHDDDGEVIEEDETECVEIKPRRKPRKRRSTP